MDYAGYPLGAEEILQQQVEVRVALIERGY